jgi:hypothetical protein
MLRSIIVTGTKIIYEILTLGGKVTMNTYAPAAVYNKRNQICLVSIQNKFFLAGY